MATDSITHHLNDNKLPVPTPQDIADACLVNAFYEHITGNNVHFTDHTSLIQLGKTKPSISTVITLLHFITSRECA